MENDHTSDVTMVIIAGIRPHFIKLAAFKNIVEKFNAISRQKINLISIHSGQHYTEDLAGSIIRELGLDFEFVIDQKNHSSIHIFGNMIIGIYEILQSINPRPDWVVIFGDANTSAAGAIAASKAEIPIIHIEAGSAVSEEKTPEALNGRVIEQLTTAFFCVSQLAAQNLRDIGIDKNIFLTGDITRDFVKMYSSRLPVGFKDHEPGSYVIVTIHRSENLKSRDIIDNLINVLSNHKKNFLFIIHPNTANKMMNWGLSEFNNIYMIPALPYGEMLSAMLGSEFIITDSGGLQREAYYLNKRCLVLLDIEFWPNLTRSGFHKLISRDRQSLEAGLKWIEGEIARGFSAKIEDMGHDDLVIEALSSLLGDNGL